MNLVKNTEQFFKKIDETLTKLESQGLCGCGSPSYMDLLEKQKIELLQINYFWHNLFYMDPREGYMEIHHAPEFKEDDLKRSLKSLLETYLPPEQENPVVVKKETVQVPVHVPIDDNVRLAHELLFGFGRAQNIHDALAIYHEEADKKSNVYAFNALGELYYLGTLIPKDLKKAKHYFEKSAKAKNSEGLYHKGLLYEKGIIMTENRMDKAIEYYEEAANLGNLDAITDLGYIYQHGIKDEAVSHNYQYEPNLDLALEKYRIAAKADFPRALNNLGLLLSTISTNETIKGENKNKAFRYFEKAASFGYLKALFNMALCFEKGIGVSSDPVKALSVYKEGAYKGDLSSKLFYAYHSLKRSLQNEENFEGDLSESARLMLELTFVKPDLPEPYYYIGTLYENGLTVSKDYKSALNYYTMAAKLGHPPSINRLGDFYNSGYGGLIKNEELALRYYTEAADLNSIDAIINLATIYEEGGYGKIERDYKKAFELYEMAASLGDSRGFLNLGYLYDKGKFLPKDSEKAKEYYLLAAEHGNEQAQSLLEIKSGISKGNNSNIRPPEMFITKKSILGSSIVVNLAKNFAKIGIKGGFNVVNKYERLEKS